GRPVLEAGLDRVVHHLVGVDVAPARHLLPGPLLRRAPGTAVAGRVAEQAARGALAEHQLVALTRELEVLAPLRVVLGDDQVHASVFDVGHRALPLSCGGSGPSRLAASPSRGSWGL